jgi:hypothetical protein
MRAPMLAALPKHGVMHWSPARLAVLCPTRATPASSVRRDHRPVETLPRSGYDASQ